MLTVKPLGFLLGASLTACVVADAGDDFSNNLISDLAPLLALFGERVTTQFMSQSVGWADNIILAVAPLGILTAIVSAIRVGGPSWLKTIIGRARENRAVAESELMSSTSHEVCELWNGQEVVRVMGAGPIREFIVLTCEESIIHENQLKKATAIEADTARQSGPKHGQNRESDNIKHAQEVAIMELRDAMGVYLTKFQPSFWERALASRRQKGSRSTWKPAASGAGVTTPQPVDSGRDSRSERSAAKQQGLQPQDPEKALPVLDAQGVVAPQSGTAESHATPRKRLVAVIRNTNVCTPNLTLNIHSQISRRELYVVSLIGVTLQLGVLVYFGITTEFSTLRFTLLKDGNLVAGYALPCAVVGTVLLVASMLICAHVVENSTSEMRYRPVDGMEARVVWLQRSETVNDQAFDSFAIFPAQTQTVITTSRRAPRRRLAAPWWPKQKEAEATRIEVEEVAAVVGALVGICGFIVQFVGLRSMHWSASAAQLGATIIMSIFRASVRRNLSKNPQSQPLLPGHEMDWLAMALGDCANEFWLNKSGRPWDWRVVAVEDPSKSEKLQRESGTAGRDLGESMSHRATLTRRDLGALADWYGPASADAIALARAIEATLNAFDDLIDRDGKEFIWSLPALKPFDAPNREPIAFRVQRQEDGNWVTYADEIEAALSLWLYSVHERENPKSSVERDRGEEGGDAAPPNAKLLRPRGDEWLRSKGSPAKRSLRLLGSYNHVLQQDLRLWMPDGSARVIRVGQDEDKATDESKMIEMEKHRIVGHASGWTDSGSPEESRIRLNKTPLPDQHSAVYEPTMNTILATESYSPLKTLFIQHMFATFMWATAKTIEKPIADSADIRITEVDDEANGVLRRRSFALHTGRLSKMAQDIQSTGLGSLEEVYLCILPPLSMENKLPPSCKHTRDVNGRTPLHLVATAGSEADVKRIVELGADKDARDDNNQTPLHVAIVKGNMAVATAVVKLGANVEARTFDGWTPLATAARHGHAAIVKILVQRGGNKEARTSDGWTPLAIAARYGHAAVAETLIDLGANKEAETLDGWTPLVLAARYGHTRVVEALIRLGVSANAVTNRGWSPLFQAASEGEEGTARMLIMHGANREVKNLAGRTPLHGAASKGATAAVKALVELKADKEARDNFNGTPLHWAAAGGHMETARALVELGANKQSRVSGGWISHYEAIVAGDQNMKSIAGEEEGSGGQTPMHLAAMNGHATVVKDLIELGADRNAKDRHGMTPLDWAAEGGHAAVVQLLN